MSRSRALDQRLALYGELGGIMNAMRSFALVELHRLAAREAAQQQTRQMLEQAMRELAPALPPPQASRGDIWVLIGTARGFCAGLNDEVLRCWQAHAGDALASIALGERLAALMPPGVVAIPGPAGAAGTVAALDSMLQAVEQARQRVGGQAGLVLCLRDDAGAVVKRLLPLPQPESGGGRELPLTNEPPARVALGVAEHYLYHSLLALLLSALRVENRLRLIQMDNARQHIDRASAELMSARNRLRQEEIIEELELIERAAMPG